MSIVADRAAEIETRLNDLLNGQFDRASEALKTAKISLASDDAVRGRVEAQLLELPQLQARLKARVVELQTLAPGSTRLAFAADAAADAQAFLSRAAAHTKDLSTTLKHGIDTASDAVNFATGVVASFQDNPARRTASLILGVSAGMVASAIVGINMFTAVLEQGAGRLLSGTLGVLATGIVIGLGSNPTHEVVKALQNYKKSRQPRTAASLTIETGEPLAERLHFEEANEEGLRRIQFDRSDRVLGITGPWTSVRSEPDAFRIVRRKTAIMIRTTD